MIQKSFNSAILFSFVALLLTACSKENDLPLYNPQPQPQPGNEMLAIRLQAAITVGDVLYDSIPANFTITSWDNNGVALTKDTLLNAGAQLIYLPKAASRYSLKMQKWGETYEKLLNRSALIEGTTYQLGGNKEAKKLQLITEETYTNGVSVLTSKQQFVYDDQGRINEIHAYAPDPSTGGLRSGSMDIFLYGPNEVWVNNIRKSDGVLLAHSAYTFDDQKRIIKTRYQYLTENHVYSNVHTNDGIEMFFGEGTINPNGSRIALKFVGGNRVEEKTIIPNYPTTTKQYRYDFNINPYAVIKMPRMYFELSSKNNVLVESWEGQDQSIQEYTYDAAGYVTQVITKFRKNNGGYENLSRTTYSY